MTWRYWQWWDGRVGIFLGSLWLTAMMAILAVPAWALTPLNDAQMSSVNGKGLAFGFDDFRFQMAPTSYFNQVGGNVTASTSFNRGDLYWVGTTISAGTANGASVPGGSDAGLYNFSDYTYVNNKPTAPSGQGHAGESMLSPLSYPIAKGGTQGYAAVNNPFVLRVRTYDAVGLKAGNRHDWVAGVPNTMLELLGPTHSTNFRWAFWGEVDTFNKTTGSYPYVSSNTRGDMVGPAFQNQDIIIGSPTSCFKPDCSTPSADGTNKGRLDTSSPIAGPVFRLYQSMASDGTNDQTMGMIYHHRLSGDWRFSVNQKDSRTVNADGSLKRGVVPAFSSQEGMYFMHVNTYLPLGIMHYQSMVLDGQQDGNFALELTRIPNDPDAYDDFYSTADATGYQRTGRDNRYYETHGYVRWGNNFPSCSGPNCLSGTGVSNVRFALTGNSVPSSTNKQVLNAGGMAFVAKQGSSWSLLNNPNDSGSQRVNVTAINLGASRVEGMTIQHMKIQTLGAAN